MSNLFKSFCSGIRRLVAIMFRRDPPYHIEEVSVKAQTILVRCRGTRTAFKITFESAISGSWLVPGLDSGQAAMLGGYYGRALRAATEGREVLKKVKNMSFLLSNKRGRYKIVFQDRNGDIGYYDQKTRQEFVEHPLTIVSNDYIISEFDSSQACYIGILAGVSLEKAAFSSKSLDEINEIISKPPKLRVVE